MERPSNEDDASSTSSAHERLQEALRTMALKALIIDDIHPVASEILGKHMKVKIMEALNTDELAGVIAPYHVLVMRISANIGSAVLDKAVNLKVVASATAGLNHIDLEQCKAKNIAVVNASGGNSESVAELTIGRMIDLLREVPRANKEVKAGIWDRARYGGRELMGKTLGLIAIGNVGARVAEIAKCFGMTVLAYDPYVTEDAAARMGVELTDLERLLAQSDIVSIHAPFTPQTRHMISKAQIEKMKDGAYIVNMGRGGIVDEEAAYHALRSGKLAGMGADVMEQEPCADSPLYALENFIVSPHVGGQTPEALERMASLAAQRALRALGIED